MYNKNMSKDEGYLGVILEDMNDKFDRIIEAVGQMQDELQKKPDREEFDELKADVKIIKAALTDTNARVHDHEVRIAKLETV